LPCEASLAKQFPTIKLRYFLITKYSESRELNGGAERKIVMRGRAPGAEKPQIPKAHACAMYSVDAKGISMMLIPRACLRNDFDTQYLVLKPLSCVSI